MLQRNNVISHDCVCRAVRTTNVAQEKPRKLLHRRVQPLAARKPIAAIPMQVPILTLGWWNVVDLLCYVSYNMPDVAAPLLLIHSRNQNLLLNWHCCLIFLQPLCSASFNQTTCGFSKDVRSDTQGDGSTYYCTSTACTAAECCFPNVSHIQHGACIVLLVAYRSSQLKYD